jgi:DnaJ-domain-containing protein 1
MSLRTLFIILAVVYFISPFDLIPDRFGWLSRIDDFAVMLYLWWKYNKIASHKASGAETEKAKPHAETPPVPRSPEEVLNIQKGATQDEIESSYRRLMSQYHPDKVTHLGPDLQKLAHEKTIEIQRAYEELTR